MSAEAVGTAAFPILFAVGWCAISHVLAHIGGWHALGQRYRRTGPVEGKLWYLRSGKLRGVNYGSCLTIGSGRRGLLLSIMLPFRPGHPPLVVPWSDVTAQHVKLLCFPMVRLRFTHEPSITLRIGRRLGRKIALHSDGGLVLQPG